MTRHPVPLVAPAWIRRWKLALTAVLLSWCSLASADVAPPILRHAPEEFFSGEPALTLARAIRQDDVAAIDRTFARYPSLDPNSEGRQGMTFLVWAFAHEYVRSARALVAHRAGVNRPLHLQGAGGPYTTTLLHFFVSGGADDKQVSALLDLGADPRARDASHETALDEAVLIDDPALEKLLIRRGADINAADGLGVTAVVVLARLNRFDMVYYFLEHGADWRVANGEVALWTQENDLNTLGGNQAGLGWQLKVKHWLSAKGVRFPVPGPGAARYASIRQRWERTPEGLAWRRKLDLLGARPDVVGTPWVEQEDAAFAAMQLWMKQKGIPAPAF